jgi:hypothetical protein
LILDGFERIDFLLKFVSSSGLELAVVLQKSELGVELSLTFLQQNVARGLKRKKISRKLKIG